MERITVKARALPDDHSCWDGIDAKGSYRYTISRQTADGGFCFYASAERGVAEPNAVDTHAALTILRLLGRPVVQTLRCVEWLGAQQNPDGSFSTLVIGFSVLVAFRLLGENPPRDPRAYLRKEGERLWPTAPRQTTAGWLLDSCRCIALWRQYGMRLSGGTRQAITATLTGLRHKDGGYGSSGSNLIETAAALAVGGALRLKADPGQLAYTRACEGAPYGFNLTPAAVTTSLEALNAGLKVLAAFGAMPRYPDLVRNYVAGCQTAQGGFGRALGAIARLDDTRRALEILAALRGAPGRRAVEDKVTAPSDDQSDSPRQ